MSSDATSGPCLLDADARRAVALQALEVGAGQVEVIVQGGGGLGIDQLRGSAAG